MHIFKEQNSFYFFALSGIAAGHRIYESAGKVK